MNNSRENAEARRLVEQYGPRQAYRLLVAQMLHPETTIEEVYRPSRVPDQPRKIIIRKQVPDEMRNRPTAPPALASPEDTLYWISRWLKESRAKSLHRTG